MMKYNIKYWSKDKGNEEYPKVAQSLMRKLMREMAQATMRYDSAKYNIFEVPYNTNERGLDAIFLPALSKICKGIVLTEVYTIRKPSKKDNTETEEHNGRVDYWCIYKGYSFMIELKHSWEYIGSEQLRDVTKQRWEKMKQQLSELRQYTSQYDEYTKQIIPLGIHIMTMYSNSNTQCENRLAKIKKHPCELFSEIAQQTDPNFQSLWLLPDKLVQDECKMHDINNPSQLLSMMAYIAKPIKHDGGKNYKKEH